MKSSILITLLAVGSALTLASVNAQPVCSTAPASECTGCGGKEKKKDTEKKDAFVNCGDKGDKKKDKDGTENVFSNGCDNCGGDKEKKKDTEKKDA